MAVHFWGVLVPRDHDVALAAALAVLCGCGAQASGRDPGVSGGFETLSDSAQGDDDDSDESTGDSPETTGPPGVGECQAIVSEALVGAPPQDILILVDNSDSMVAEAGFVQAQLNLFSAMIGTAEVNAHIILMTALPSVPAGLCIDPPLGSGGCPNADSNPPSFLHIDTAIGSRDALFRVQNLYDDYVDTLRLGATTHVVVISDEDTDKGPGTFLDEMVGVSARFEGLKFHAIVPSEDPGDACETGSPCCEYASSRGSRYEQIVEMTGGVLGDLCQQEFQPIFEALAQEVIAEATLSCEFEIPPAPEGEVFDRDEVNVSFDAGTGSTFEFGRAESSSQCADVPDGWFYDDPEDPRRIVLCPQTCERVQGIAQASIAVRFGCATIPAG